MAKKTKGIKVKEKSDSANNFGISDRARKIGLSVDLSKNRKNDRKKKSKKKKTYEKIKYESDELFSLTNLKAVPSDKVPCVTQPMPESELVSGNESRVKEQSQVGLTDDSMDAVSISSQSDITSDDSVSDDKHEDVSVNIDSASVQLEENTSSQNILKKTKYIALENHKDVYGLLIMEKDSEVSVTGQFCLNVIKGKIHVFGYEVTDQQNTQVFSSRVTGVLKLQDTSCKKIAELSSKCLDEIKELFKKNHVGVIDEITTSSSAAWITKTPQSRISFATNMKAYTNSFSDVPEVNFEEKAIHSAIETKYWQPIASDVVQCFSNSEGHENSVVLLCGNKNTGKSTFARFLLNSLLNSSRSVFFLECDVGQTELTPPGVISISCIQKPLLGPPFTHQSTPARSYFFGNITPRDDPKTYIYCIKEAFRFYLNNCKSKGPLVINTQGWIKGIGLSLLIDVIRVTSPSIVLQFKTALESSKNVFTLSSEFVQSQPGWVYTASKKPSVLGDNDDSAETNLALGSELRHISNQVLENEGNNDNLSATRFVTVSAYEGASTNAARLKAVDHRRLTMLAYFGEMLIKEKRDSFPDFIDQPLEYFVPRILYWKDIAVHVMHCKVPPSMTMLSLNFSVVSLAIVAPSTMVELSKDVLPSGPRFIRGNPIATHVGFGFIRNIDVSRKCFVILTPESETSLAKVNAILKGAVDMPIGVFDQSSTSPVYCAAEQQSVIRGSSARKPRFNLKRKKFDSPAGHR